MTIKRDVLLFESEGRENTAECIHGALDACQREDATALVVFTGEGIGLMEAFRGLVARPELKHVRLIGVTFPPTRVFQDETGQPFTAGIKEPELFAKLGIPIVAAHLPFSPILHLGGGTTPRSLPNEILGMFGGGMALCVQGIAMACDAGQLQPGDRVVSMTADTAIVARASSTDQLFDKKFGIVIESIVCKPRRFTVTRKVQTEQLEKKTFPGTIAPIETKALSKDPKG